MEIEKLEADPQNNDYTKLDEKRKDLENIRKEKLKGTMIRSRAEWLCESEKPSSYFCSLEKHYYSEKTIKKLVTDNGAILSDQNKILNEVKCFYQNLFKSRDSNISDNDLSCLQELSGVRKLSDAEANTLEGLLTVDEIANKLKFMKNKKNTSH